MGMPIANVCGYFRPRYVYLNKHITVIVEGTLVEGRFVEAPTNGLCLKSLVRFWQHDHYKKLNETSLTLKYCFRYRVKKGGGIF